jgi:hypothetical protein
MSAAFYRWSLSLLCLASTTQAGVLLEKVKYPGEVMPSYAISSRCTLSDTGLLVQHQQLGDLISKRKTQLQITTANIKAKITQTALGKVTSSIFPVDAQTIIYRAYQKQPDGSVKQILLYEENGGSGQKKVNDAQEAIALRNFIDLNCGDPLTY